MNNELINNIRLVNINNNKELITKGVLFDDEHTCYHDYDDFNDIIIGFMLVALNYGIFIKDEFIGLISIFPHYYKDLSRLEIAISIKNEYRNKKIGKYCLKNIIDICFKEKQNKSIHLSIREDNIKSRKMAEGCGFKIYKGYRCDDTFTDLDGNVMNQVQYLLKRKDYLK